MKKKSTLLFFTLAIVFSTAFGQVQRKVLAEEFTNANCCENYQNHFDNLMLQNLDIATSIQYHVNWPSEDIFYIDNPTDNQNRIQYYEVGTIPYAILDGNFWSGVTNTLRQSDFDDAASISSPFKMQIQTQLSTNEDTIFVTTIIESFNIVSTSQLIAHNVVVEKHLHFNTPPGSNGLYDYYNVMKKMLPSALGTSIAPMNVGDYIILENSWALENIYDTSQLAVVGFVQNNYFKIVYQSALSSEEDLNPVYTLDAEIFSIENVDTTNCSGTINPHIKIRNNGQEALTNMTIEYSVNNGDVQTSDWVGNLSFLETAFIELDEIIFNVMDTNELVVLGINPNGATDEYEKNNTLTFTFVSPSLSEEIYLALFFDDNPEETTWELLNSLGEIIQEGGPYTTPNGIKVEPLEVSSHDCYELVMYDAGGNGMCCNNGDGSYSVVYGNNQTAFGGASFGELDRNQFNYDPVGVSENIVFNEMNIFPNPVNDILNINFNLFESSDISIHVYDMQGRIITETVDGYSQSGNKDYKINLVDLNSGVYLLKLNIGEDTFVEKITMR